MLPRKRYAPPPSFAELHAADLPASLTAKGASRLTSALRLQALLASRAVALLAPATDAATADMTAEPVAVAVVAAAAAAAALVACVAAVTDTTDEATVVSESEVLQDPRRGSLQPVHRCVIKVAEGHRLTVAAQPTALLNTGKVPDTADGTPFEQPPSLPPAAAAQPARRGHTQHFAHMTGVDGVSPATFDRAPTIVLESIASKTTAVVAASAAAAAARPPDSPAAKPCSAQPASPQASPAAPASAGDGEDAAGEDDPCAASSPSIGEDAEAAATAAPGFPTLSGLQKPLCATIHHVNPMPGAGVDVVLRAGDEQGLGPLSGLLTVLLDVTSASLTDVSPAHSPMAAPPSQGTPDLWGCVVEGSEERSLRAARSLCPPALGPRRGSGSEWLGGGRGAGPSSACLSLGAGVARRVVRCPAQEFAAVGRAENVVRQQLVRHGSAGLCFRRRQ